MKRKQKQKLALIGAEGYQRLSQEHRVDCFPWDKIATIENLRDYDTVVIDLLSLGLDSRTSPETLRTGKVNWEAFHHVLNPVSMRDILGDGSIIVVGDPRFSIRRNEGTSAQPAYYTKPFLAWTGIKFYWDNQPGDTVSFASEWDHGHFKEYVKHLKRWDYSLRSFELDLDVLGKLYNIGKDSAFVPRLNTDLFCQNRYGGALAFTTSINIERKGTYAYGSEAVVELGHVTYLPKIELTEDETLVLILRDLCGIEAPLPEPPWITEYVAPGQETVDEEIQQIETRIEATLQEYREATTRRANTRICLQLLYERGLALESAVQKVLALIGASVEVPANPGKEDGWISVSIGTDKLEAVLEIKGTKNPQFDETGIRQLLDWVHRGIEMRQKKYKGIFIGNSYVNNPPKERPDPFADNWRKSAELHNFAALRSEDLYLIYVLHSLGKLDTNRFWQDLFNKNGVLDVGPYIEVD